DKTGRGLFSSCSGPRERNSSAAVVFAAVRPPDRATIAVTPLTRGGASSLPVARVTQEPVRMNRVLAFLVMGGCAFLGGAAAVSVGPKLLAQLPTAAPGDPLRRYPAAAAELSVLS